MISMVRIEIIIIFLKYFVMIITEFKNHSSEKRNIKRDKTEKNTFSSDFLSVSIEEK